MTVIMAALFVFVFGFFVDILYTKWTLAVQERAPIEGAVSSAAIQLFGLVSVLAIVQGSAWLILPNAAGHALGTYVAVRKARVIAAVGPQDVRRS